MGMSISKDTQELIVSALLKNSYLYNTSKSEMTDGYFSDPACKVIYKALTVYYGKYNTTPSLNEILITIEDCYLPMVGLSLEEVKTTCQKLYGYEEQSENFIKDKITDFIRKVKSSSVLSNFLTQIRDNPNLSLESDSVVAQLSKALEVQLSNTEVFDMTDMAQVKKARVSAVGSEDNSTIVKSIFNGLNNNLMFGGFQPSTVNMVVSPPGCFTGETVINTDKGYFTLENLYNTNKNIIENLKIYGCYNSCILEGGFSEVYLSDYVDELIEIKIRDHAKTIKCTIDHPFLIEGDHYIRADQITLNTSLRGSISLNHKEKYSKTFEVESIKRIYLKEKVPVYGLVDAKPFNNFEIMLDDMEGLFVGNTGKTMYLINEGVNAAKQGFDVLHVFIGDMKEYDGFIRYLSCASGYNQNTLVLMNDEKQAEVVNFVNQQYDNVLTRIKMLVYPSLSLSVEQLMEDIVRFEKQLKKDFGLIIIDYPDNLIQDGKSLYEDGGTLYSSLEKLSRMTQSVLLVASQPKQFFWGQEIIPLEGAAESSKKQMVIDIMINMNASWRGANFGSILLAKCRKGEVGKILRFKSDFAKCKIEEVDENTYNLLKASSTPPVNPNSKK